MELANWYCQHTRMESRFLSEFPARSSFGVLVLPPYQLRRLANQSGVFAGCGESMRFLEFVRKRSETCTVLKRAVVALVAVVVSAAPAFAHHSYAMFDKTKRVTVEGTVRDWQWTNPHIWLELTVVEGGATQYYSLEGAGPSSESRRGWNRNTVKVGDKITVVLFPLKDGRRGGSLLSITKDGVMLGNLPAPSPAP